MVVSSANTFKDVYRLCLEQRKSRLPFALAWWMHMVEYDFKGLCTCKGDSFGSIRGCIGRKLSFFNVCSNNSVHLVKIPRDWNEGSSRNIYAPHNPRTVCSNYHVLSSRVHNVRTSYLYP